MTMISDAAKFVPHFVLDLTTASSNAFDQFLVDFEAWRATQPQREVDLTNGWKTVTQESAEGYLLRNPLAANRKVALPTVRYYARLMTAGMWKPTGQPLLFDTTGKGIDLGHRLFACYLSGASFPTYLIGDVPPDPEIFAYLDGGKGRTAADALATAGLDGLAKTLAPVVNMAMHFDAGCYTPSTKRPLGKVAAVEILHYAQGSEALRQAVRLMAGEHKSAAKVLGYKDVAGFLAYQILELHGEEVLDAFMGELGQIEDEPTEGSPIAALQKVMADDAHSAEPMKKHQVLGHAIKAFNSYVLDEQVKRLVLKVNEPFPKFVRPAPTQQAA